jgi:4-amino-4-deoxy-L-arabinose transferase-like glycosyltransferase
LLDTANIHVDALFDAWYVPGMMRAWKIPQLIALLLVALVVRLFHIEMQSIWFDEGWSAYAAAQPTLLQAAAADLTNPPLYYMLLHIHARFLGDSEFSLRLFSTFAGLVGIALAYRFGARFFKCSAAFYGAALLSVSPLLWWAAQEARMYTLLALLVTACAYAWHELIRQPRRKWWILLWLAELALLYAHNTGPIIAVWLNAVTFLYWLIRRSAKIPDWRVWVAGQASVCLLWLPWFAAFFLRLGDANNAVTSAPQVNIALVWQVWQAYFTGVWALVGAQPIVVALCVLLLGMSIALCLRLNDHGRWVLAHAVILTIGVIAGLIVLGNELHGRYLAMIAPLLLIALGTGIARLGARVLRWLALAPFVVLLLVVVHFAQNPLYQHDDARAMVRYYAENLTSDDSVLAWSYADRYELAYYWHRLGVTAQRITLPEGADLAEIAPLLPTSGDVALNVWYTQRADFRGMMDCVLSAGTSRTPEEYTAYGMTTLIYDDPLLQLPAMQSVAFTFGQANTPLLTLSAMPSAPRLTADQALCFPIQATLHQPTSATLKLALIAQNELGWEIARADAIFATPNQRTSDQLAAGDMLTAYPLLRLPYGAPSGEYRLYARVYDEVAMPSGYEPLTVDAERSGRDVLVGVWNVPSDSQWDAAELSSTLPRRVDYPYSESLTLVSHDVAQGVTLRNGDELRVSLLWTGTSALPRLILAAVDSDWEVSVPPSQVRADGALLDWRIVRVPSDASSGRAELRLPNGYVLAEFAIENIPAVYEVPTVDHPIGEAFVGLGELLGYTIAPPDLPLTAESMITLVWRADGQTTTNYTITVQLLGADDNVIAQSDAQPAQNTRPTTGWRAGEIVVDQHQLTFAAPVVDQQARLIVAVYDAATGTRVVTTNNEQLVELIPIIPIR